MQDVCHTWTQLNDLPLHEWAPARCSGSHGFDSWTPGLRFFLCFTLVSCWTVHFSHVGPACYVATILWTSLDVQQHTLPTGRDMVRSAKSHWRFIQGRLKLLHRWFNTTEGWMKRFRSLKGHLKEIFAENLSVLDKGRTAVKGDWRPPLCLPCCSFLVK